MECSYFCSVTLFGTGGFNPPASRSIVQTFYHEITVLAPHYNFKKDHCANCISTYLSRHLSKHEQTNDKLTSNMKVELSEKITFILTSCLVDCQCFCSLKIWRDIKSHVIVKK